MFPDSKAHFLSPLLFLTSRHASVCLTLFCHTAVARSKSGIWRCCCIVRQIKVKRCVNKTVKDGYSFLLAVCLTEFTSLINAKLCSRYLFSSPFSICLSLSLTTDECVLMVSLRGADDVDNVMFPTNGNRSRRWRTDIFISRESSEPGGAKGSLTDGKMMGEEAVIG